MYNKKAISPVVATALLLVLAVVAVVVFQGWFQTFSSSLFVDVEKKGSISNLNLGIENLIGSALYVKAGDGLNITSIKIDGNNCNISDYFYNISKINVSNCLYNLSTSTPEIVLITDKGIISKFVYIKNLNSNENESFLSSTDNWVIRFDQENSNIGQYYISINSASEVLLENSQVSQYFTVYLQESPWNLTLNYTDFISTYGGFFNSTAGQLLIIDNFFNMNSGSIVSEQVPPAEITFIGSTLNNYIYYGFKFPSTHISGDFSGVFGPGGDYFSDYSESISQRFILGSPDIMEYNYTNMNIELYYNNNFPGFNFTAKFY